MNDILFKILDEQTSEQMRKDFSRIRKERGYCEDDMSVEELLGPDFAEFYTTNKNYSDDIENVETIAVEAVTNVKLVPIEAVHDKRFLISVDKATFSLAA